MSKHHTEIEAEMNQMKELAIEMHCRYLDLCVQYEEARREFLGDEYVDVEERMRHVEAMGGKVLRK